MSWKTRERIIWTVFVLVMLWIFYKAACFLFVGLIPERRTFYITYSSFLKDAERTQFMQELPKSATRTKYFHQVFLFTYKNGYGTVIPERDYEATKEECIENREAYINHIASYRLIDGQLKECSEEEKEEYKNTLDIYSIHKVNQPEPNVAETLKHNNIDFFDQIACESAEKGDYHFLWYWIEDVPDRQFRFMGSIYNDETHEIIEVNYLKMDLSDW